MKIKLIISGVIITVLLALGLKQFVFKEEQIHFKEHKVSTETIKKSIITTGTLEPKNRLEVLPQISGRIEKIYVEEGTSVKKGQILALMSSTERATLLDAAISEGQSKVAYWETVYKPTALISPINGEVIVQNVEPGQTINTSTITFVLADKLVINCLVDEIEIGQVSKGQEAEVSIDSYPDTTIKGKVSHISYEATDVNNVTMYEVFIELDQVPSFARSGMSCSVDLIVKKVENALVISEDAILYGRNKEPMVMLKSTEERPRPTRIKTGIISNGMVEVIEGLSESDIAIKRILIKNDSSAKSSGNSFMPKPPGGGKGMGGGRPRD